MRACRLAVRLASAVRPLQRTPRILYSGNGPFERRLYATTTTETPADKTNSTDPHGFTSSIAAPEFDLEEDGEDEYLNEDKESLDDENGGDDGDSGPPKPKPELKRARIVPASASYFTVMPTFTDDLLMLQALQRKYQTLPVVPPGQAPRIAWKTLPQYRNIAGDEPIKVARYQKLVQLLHRLSHIHPSLMPTEVTEAMQKFKRDVNPFADKPKETFIDNWGRALGVGRRKSSSARAYVVEGEGEVLINGKSLAQYFGRIHDRESAIWALKATQRIDKYNIWALVKGGGVTGQAEALTLAVGKALMVHEPLLKPALRRAGCVTRDPRRVERKKAGKLKSRKMPQWVKR